MIFLIFMFACSVLAFYFTFSFVVWLLVRKWEKKVPAELDDEIFGGAK